LTLLAVVLVSAWSAAPAFANVYTFQCISNNSGQCNNSFGAQFSVNVTDAGSGQVLFTFANAGPVASFIGDVYFDDGTLLGIAQVIDGTGVDFEQGASPGDLPGGNALNPDFETTAGFNADAEPGAANGVNPGENVGILFNLINGKTFADTIAAIEAGIACTGFGADPGGNCDNTLRIGIHVQGIGTTGQSDALVLTGEPDIPDTEVPEPATLMLLGTGLGIVGAKVRNRNKKQQAAVQ
jgi:hypothetical protein